MGFAQPISIKAAVENINKNYFLPAIQREFVWSTDQIETLFDSIMKGYPIGSFLFWNVDEENIPKYQFYEFIRNYHQRDNAHNEKANLTGEKSVTAVLDGQQRLTSLYIGLKGSYYYKMARMRWDNDQAFPKRRLCLNLLCPAFDSAMDYDFQFLMDEEINARDENHYWFVVADVLAFDSPSAPAQYVWNKVLPLLKAGDDRGNFAIDTLSKLYSAINDKSINFFLEESKSLDKVLNIFIRVNSGGTQLSYSDLLLSIASAQWQHKDAREEIVQFVDEINRIGDGFNIDKDFVLKACLVLSDFSNIAFKVDNFNQDNMHKIEKNWETITESIRLSYRLLSRFGYNRDSLTSNNAVIPIAYYINKIGNPPNFDVSNKFSEDRKLIFRWLVSGLLKKVFSGQPDNVLRLVREIIKQSSGLFPMRDIFEKQRGTSKSFIFGDDEIDNLFRCKYGNAFTYSILALLYPSLNFKGKFHEDHIFPKSLFTESKLKKLNVPERDIEFCLENYNCVANLQLLEGIPNEEKSQTMFDQWIEIAYPDKTERVLYMERNYIPNVSLDIRNFREFIEKRSELIKKEIKELLGDGAYAH